MKILFINACVRKESRTLVLANELLSGLPGEIEELKLIDLNLKPLDERRISSRLKDEHEQVLAKEFANADIIVIAAPLWDLSFPALLKLYVENISIGGITFKYTENGIVGLCKAKKLYYVSTSGGTFIPNFGYEYIKALSNVMFGIKEVLHFEAEGLDVWENNIEDILNDAIIKIEDHFTEEKE